MGRKCIHLRLADGTEVMACGSFPGAKACVVCGTFATRLCDHRNRDGRTCDAPLCDEHTQRAGPNRDLCPLHRTKEIQPALFGGAA